MTCLAASPAYNVVVSGSRDCSAIVWDLSRLIFVRQLRGHSAPIAAVAINEITVCVLCLVHYYFNSYFSVILTVYDVDDKRIFSRVI